MKRKFTKLGLLVQLIFLFQITAFSQGVGVNTTGAAANSSAMLDVTSTSQGMLVPRMTQAQRTAISSPANGLIVYQTDSVSTKAGFWYYDGSTSAWKRITTGASASVTTPVSLSNGGTNASLSATSGGIVYSNASQLQVSAAGTGGQVLTSNGAGTPIWSSLGQSATTIFGTSALSSFNNTTYTLVPGLQITNLTIPLNTTLIISSSGAFYSTGGSPSSATELRFQIYIDGVAVGNPRAYDASNTNGPPGVKAQWQIIYATTAYSNDATHTIEVRTQYVTGSSNSNANVSGGPGTDEQGDLTVEILKN